MVDYVNVGQQLQSGILTNTIFWVITIALFILVIAIAIVGFKKILNSGRLTWFILHSISIFLIGYIFKDVNLNQYLFVLIMAILVTLLSTFYRYVMFNVVLKLKDCWKNLGFWALINFFSFLFVQIIYNVIKLTDPFLKVIFAAFFITLAGALVNRDFKPTANFKPTETHKFNNYYPKHHHNKRRKY